MSLTGMLPLLVARRPGDADTDTVGDAGRGAQGPKVGSRPPRAVVVSPPRWGLSADRGSRPSRCARPAASTREWTSSLSKMWPTWVLTVFGLMNSRCAISRLVRPSASSPSTSVSRAVSPSPSVCRLPARLGRPAGRQARGAGERFEGVFERPGVQRPGEEPGLVDEPCRDRPVAARRQHRLRGAKARVCGRIRLPEPIPGAYRGLPRRGRGGAG